MGRPAIMEPESVPFEDAELNARLFRTLDDATRLKILNRLLEQEALPQKDIVDFVGLSQGRVSQQLACLTWCGFVLTTRVGRRTYYRLASPQAGALLDLGRMFLETTEGDIGSCRIAS